MFKQQKMAFSREVQRIWIQPDVKLSRQSKVDKKEELQKEFQWILVQLNSIRTCLTCTCQFKPIDNFNYRGCMMHWGEKRRLRGEWTYTCCGGTIFSRGCVSAFHVSDSKIRDEMMKNPIGYKAVLPRRLVDSDIISIDREMIDSCCEKNYKKVFDEKGWEMGKAEDSEHYFFHVLSI